jgi:hypothetical protein
MSIRLSLSCGAILLILVALLLVPCAGAQPQSAAGLGAEEETQPTGEVRPEEANQEAIEKLRRMSPEEIKALDKKLAEAMNLPALCPFSRR